MVETSQDKPLTAKQLSFIDYYTDTQNKKTFNNAKESAIEAGYSIKSAKLSGHRNITNDNCKLAIDKKREEFKAENIATRQIRQQFWTETMKNAPLMSDRLRASELLGKSEADFIDIHKDITEQQRELTEQEVREAKRMAQIMLREATGAA
jgi:phage terminase small subunit